MSKKIYKVPLEERIDIISYIDKPHLVREIWLFFDSSVFILLTNFFVKKEQLSPELKEDFSNLIHLLSGDNLNVHPLSLIEAGRDRSGGEMKFNERKWIDHLYALLIAQCVDLENSSFDSPDSWKVSKAREEFILSEFRYQYNCLTISELAVSLYRSLSETSHKLLKETIKFNDKASLPFLRAAHQCNIEGRDNHQKLSIFFDLIKDESYCAKIVDYCIRIILESASEPLLKKALNKIKKEPENTAWDIAIFEQAQLANFLEPFTDLKPIVTFYTCDKNLYYYSQLGRPLVIKILKEYSRVYYPDLSFIREKKDLRLIKNYFDNHFYKNPEDLRCQIIDDIREDLNGIPLNDDITQFLAKIQCVNFSEFVVFKNFFISEQRLN